MTSIVTLIEFNDRKPEVSNLQHGLLLLIDRRRLTIPSDQLVRTISELAREREAQVYAKFTSKPVQTFQEQYAAQFSLHLSGNVETGTAQSFTQLAA